MGKKSKVLFVEGDVACAEGAIAAGCRFYAAYPITPATEVAEHMARRLPEVGGVFIQMEDEIASIAAVIGASWAGVKAMTATSGPGFSLMQENIGLAVMMEVPCVIIDVQRAGPSTGLPTLWAQADVMQSRWGSHGDYEIIALAPSTVQECFDFTIEAFNLSEQYRVPTVLLTDAIIGHLTEKLTIPPEKEIKLVERKYTDKKPEEYLPYAGDELVPPISKAGDGYKIHATGLTHDERGYPAMNGDAHKKLIERLCAKITKNKDKIIRIEENDVDNADVIVIAYGVTPRIIYPALERARKKGIKIGLFRPVTIWPFPYERIRELSNKVKGLLVVELNMGQIFHEVHCAAVDTCKVEFVGHPGGGLPDIEEVFNKLVELA